MSFDYILAGLVLFILVPIALLFPKFLIYFTLITSALGGRFQGIKGMSLGSSSLSISGMKWIVTWILALLVMLIHFKKVRFPKIFIPYTLFILWEILRFFSSEMAVAGLKDILFFSFPLVIGLYVIMFLDVKNQKTEKKILNAYLFSSLFPLFLYIILIPAGVIEYTNKGPMGIIHPRAIALYLLQVLSISLALWKYGESPREKRRGFWFGLYSIGLIFFTLSRTASLVALGLLFLSRLKPKYLWRFALSGILALPLVIYAILAIPAFQERFFLGDKSGAKQDGQMINMAGRNILWPFTFERALRNPIIGWGTGTSQEYGAKLLNPMLKERTKEFHIHNEFLQIFYDTGVIGLALLTYSLLFFFFRFWKDWKNHFALGNKTQTKLSAAITLGIVAVIMTSITDNTIHYAFVMSPLFILMAISHFNKTGNTFVSNS